MAPRMNPHSKKESYKMVADLNLHDELLNSQTSLWFPACTYRLLCWGRYRGGTVCGQRIWCWRLPGYQRPFLNSWRHRLGMLSSRGRSWYIGDDFGWYSQGIDPSLTSYWPPFDHENDLLSVLFVLLWSYHWILKLLFFQFRNFGFERWPFQLQSHARVYLRCSWYRIGFMCADVIGESPLQDGLVSVYWHAFLHHLQTA